MSTIDRINLVLPWVSEHARAELEQVKRDIGLILSCSRNVSFQLNCGYDVDEASRLNLDFAVRAVEGRS